MLYDREISDVLSAKLLSINAIKLSPSNPFTWASGLKSPIYCDNRKTLSYPEIRNYIKESFASAIRELYTNVDTIVGVATAGIAHGALVADVLDLPFCYVRSKAKGHGLENLIEGHFEQGAKAVVIEDLISTGGSSLKAVDAMRDAQCEVLGLGAIFSYGFEQAESNFNEAQCNYFTLGNYESLLPIAHTNQYISELEKDNLESWYKDPARWSAKVEA